VRDEQQRDVGDRGARLDEPLHPPAGADELQQVLLVLVVRSAHDRARGAGAAATPSEAIEQTHGPKCAASGVESHGNTTCCRSRIRGVIG
jgi:hypothetical protein